jgi:hypothetical protein
MIIFKISKNPGLICESFAIKVLLETNTCTIQQQIYNTLSYKEKQTKPKLGFSNDSINV